MQGLQALDHLGQHFGGLIQRKHPVIKFSLVIDQIAPITIFQKEVVEVLVFINGVEPDDVRGIHGPHALDLSVKVVL